MVSCWKSISWTVGPLVSMCCVLYCTTQKYVDSLDSTLTPWIQCSKLSRIKARISSIKNQDAQRTFWGSWLQLQGNNLILASRTIAKDKGLDKWLCDTEATCMCANISIFFCCGWLCLAVWLPIYMYLSWFQHPLLHWAVCPSMCSTASGLKQNHLLFYRLLFVKFMLVDGCVMVHRLEVKFVSMMTAISATQCKIWIFSCCRWKV